MTAQKYEELSELPAQLQQSLQCRYGSKLAVSKGNVHTHTHTHTHTLDYCSGTRKKEILQQNRLILRTLC